MRRKSYSELSRFDTFEDRFNYLKLHGGVGRSTFGFDRYINQRFYTSRQWKEVKNFVVVRDNGCDLGIIGYEIEISPLIHHMNPMNVDDILSNEPWILDPEFLILTTTNTHNAIHFGVENAYPRVVTQRTPNDTQLWARR
jgi:hypothetical protein